MSLMMSSSLGNSASTDFLSSTSPPPVCTPPADSISINAYLPEDCLTTSKAICPIGSCVCPSQPPGWQNTFFFGSQFFDNISLNAGPSFSVKCGNQSEICVCDTTGRCFSALGENLLSVDFHAYCSTSISQSVVPSQTSTQTQQVIPDPWVSAPGPPCTAAVTCTCPCSDVITTITNTQTTTYTYTPIETCAMYAVLQCVDPFDEDGLTYNDGQVNVTCASQLNANNVSQLLSPTSNYLKVASVGCGGCPNPISNCGPYVAPFSDPSLLFE
uniref:Uncharacterized protein n=1 Tax=Ditylenchus dipsaci TaxID=166011 RepID=A0A915EEW3_9BILA